MSLVPPDHAVAVRPGVQVFRLASGQFVLHTGGDDFLVPELPPQQQAALADLLTGTRTLDECTDAFAAGELDALLSALVDEGVIDLGGPRDEPAGTAGAAALEGAGPLAAAVADLLQRSGVRVLPVAGEEPPAEADVLIACAGWLPDRRWQQIDRACARRGLPWHRAHRDGRSVWVGPFTVQGHSAGYLDTRRRLLAATDTPDLLEGLWRHLDASEHTSDLPWPDEGALALVAGVLAGDVVGHLRGGPVPSAGDQWELDLATRRWTVHPVLPVPPDLLTEAV